MNRRKAPLLLALALLVAGSALLVSRSPAVPAAASGAVPARADAASPHAAPHAAFSLARPADAVEPEVKSPAEEVDPVAALRARYGGHLHEPHTQMRMLEQLMRYFQQRNPTGWEADLLALVRQAFPEMAEELALRLRQRVEYARWMDAHHQELLDQSPDERRAAVWKKREELFGAQVAEELWQGELRATALSNALTSIDALPSDVGVGERLARYQQSLQHTYGEETPGYLHEHQQELMNHFLDLGSVQRDLDAMTPEQRAASLREVRQGMGLDAAALDRWKELDTRRDARWELGTQYMNERASLVPCDAARMSTGTTRIAQYLLPPYHWLEFTTPSMTRRPTLSGYFAAKLIFELRMAAFGTHESTYVAPITEPYL